MNFKFSNLLGAPYRGGNLIIHGNDLLSPVGNRISQVCLQWPTIMCVLPHGACTGARGFSMPSAEALNNSLP